MVNVLDCPFSHLSITLSPRSGVHCHLSELNYAPEISLVRLIDWGIAAECNKIIRQSYNVRTNELFSYKVYLAAHLLNNAGRGCLGVAEVG